MSTEINPYESPGEVTPPSDVLPASSREVDWLAIWGWPTVFAANAVVPTLFGLGLVGQNEGRIGMALGCAVMLAIGWLICLTRPRLVRTTITGACVLIFSQLFPIFQMIAGSLSIAAAEKMGLPMVRRDEEMLNISGDITTFVVTMSTAALHIGLAFAIGAALGAMLGVNLNEESAKPKSVPGQPV